MYNRALSTHIRRYNISSLLNKPGVNIDPASTPTPGCTTDFFLETYELRLCVVSKLSLSNPPLAPAASPPGILDCLSRVFI